MTQKRKTLEVMNAERDEFNKLGNFANCKTLRDYFAGLALSGFISSLNMEIYHDPKDYAPIAYEWADAMLEARKTLPKGDIHD
jgi:hypothetical protein